MNKKVLIALGVILLIGSATAAIISTQVDWQSWFGDTGEYDEALKRCEAENCVITAPPRWFFLVHEDGVIEPVTLIEVNPQNPENFPMLREDYQPRTVAQL